MATTERAAIDIDIRALIADDAYARSFQLNVWGQSVNEFLLLLCRTLRQRRKGSCNPFCAASLTLNLANQSRRFRRYCSEFHQGPNGVDRWKLVKWNATNRQDRKLQSANLPVPMVRSIAVCWIGPVLVRSFHCEFDLVADLEDIQQKAPFVVRRLLAFVSAIFFSLPPRDPDSRANCEDRPYRLYPRCYCLLLAIAIPKAHAEIDGEETTHNYSHYDTKNTQRSHDRASCHFGGIVAC